MFLFGDDLQQMLRVMSAYFFCPTTTKSIRSTTSLLKSAT